MRAGDRVTKEKVMDRINAMGTIDKITDHYIVVKWDEVPGFWHYTREQAKKLEVINEK